MNKFGNEGKNTIHLSHWGHYKKTLKKTSVQSTFKETDVQEVQRADRN